MRGLAGFTGALGLAGLAGALGLAGCTLQVPPPPTPTPTVGPAVAAGDVPIGVVLSLTGRFSREGAMMKAGYETWADAVAATGGLRAGAGRRPLRLLVEDDESEPLGAARHVERLTGAQGVRLLLGPFSSQITTAVATAAEKAGAVVVAPDASTPALYQRGLRGLFSILAPDDRLFHGLADLAATLQPRAQPLALLVADEPSLAAASAGFRERAGALGLGPVQQELIGLGTRDVTAPLERLAALAPRFILVAAEQGQTERFGPRVVELLPTAQVRAFVPLPEPPDAAGRRSPVFDAAVTVETWSPALVTSGPVLGSARDFAGRFRRLHGYEPDARCAAAAAAGVALQLAVERAGGVDPEPVRAALATLDVATFWGRLAWDQAGRNRVAVPPVLQQQGGALVAIYPPELAGGQFRPPASL